MKICYDCRNLRICVLQKDIEAAVRRSVHMIKVDAPASSLESFTHIYEAVGAACKMFHQDPAA